MKIRKICFFACILVCTLSYAQQNTIELPITLKNGYGPFKAGFGGFNPDLEVENNPWKNTYLNVIGIPEDWTDAKKGDIETNIYQTVYQNYLLGNISQEWYEELQKSWNWIPDTLNLSKQAIKSKIAFAFGKNSTGETKMVVDANNNLDFSDDEIFTPFEDFNDDLFNIDSLSMNHVITVKYERLSENKIIQESSPLFIVYAKSFDMFMCNFPKYATANLGENEIALCSGYFANPSYNQSAIVMMNDSLKDGGKVERENMLSVNEYFIVKDKWYKYKGINLNKNVLILETTNMTDNQSYSTQIGFKPFPFEGEDFKTQEPVSLDKYKGKYVFIDFWATSCSPCIKEFPLMKNLYDQMDKSHFEMLGIVGNSKAKDLKKLIEKHDIGWPQVLSDETNNIIKRYEVTGYPTSFLIDPNGIIIAKDLRGKELENKINELTTNNK
jgi:peroxiredoxin